MFDPARAQEFFSALPASPAVCLVECRGENAEPLLLRTQNLRRRLERLFATPDPSSKRLNLRDLASGVRYRPTASKFEQSYLYYQQAKNLFPERYQKLMRLRPPAVLKVSLGNAYPRCYVTRRITVDSSGTLMAGAYYGPFGTRRAAQAFAEQALDFFKVRHCQIKLRRDPGFPGCIYSEMKMCLAPCFAGCTEAEYRAEVQRLVGFLKSGGLSLQSMLEHERERASEQLDFERAATLHKRVEKLLEVLRMCPELARPMENLDGIVLQRAIEDQTIAAYAVRGGRLAEPCFVRFAEIAGQPRSAEQIFRDYLETAVPPADGAELGEHLALLARWYYSHPRQGEIVFRERDWPYRKILRACSRLLAPPSSAPDHTVVPLPSLRRPLHEGNP